MPPQQSGKIKKADLRTPVFEARDIALEKPLKTYTGPAADAQVFDEIERNFEKVWHSSCGFNNHVGHTVYIKIRIISAPCPLSNVLCEVQHSCASLAGHISTSILCCNSR